MRRYQKVIIFYPVKNNNVLMQLRDNKKDIVFPDKWGYFSGSIEKNETFFEAFKRELKEEIDVDTLKYKSKYIGKYIDKDLKIVSYNYILYMNKIRKFSLHEGVDCKYITKSIINKKKIYSSKTKKYHQIVNRPFIEKMFKSILKFDFTRRY